MSTPSSLSTNPPEEALPPPRPLERHAHMETDVFCEGCGYNLHGQPVHRDERLGLMICRCPECGRFHPAGHGTAATSLWMSRLAAWLLFFWVLIVLTTAIFAAIGFGAVQLFHVEVMSYLALVDADGRHVDHQPVGPGGTYIPVYVGTTQPANQARLKNVRTLIPPARYLQGGYQRPWWIPLIILMFAAGIGLAAGILMVTFLWHWRKRNYLWTLLIPILTAGFLSGTIWFDDWYDAIRAWSIQRVLFWGGIEAIFMFIGIQIGRPVARLFLRMFIPPKPRQHLAFLWLVDGKTPPPARDPSPM